MTSRITDIALPTATVAVLLLVWHFSITWFAIPAYLVPDPLDVLVALRKGLIEGTLWIHIGATLSAVALGYALGCFLALVCAAIMSEFDLVEKAFYPIVVGFQSIPKVALAPLLIVWFGFGLQSKVVLVALMCFFPCFINTVVGLKSYDRNLEALYRAFGSGKLDIFWSVKLPAALGHIFAGLQVSVILAILGAVVSELVASKFGLGNVIASSALNFDVAMMFACVIILSVMGILAAQIVKTLHRRLVFWENQAQDGDH